MIDVVWKFYLPRDRAKEARDGIDYIKHANAGLIDLTPGNVVDHDYIVRDMREILDSGIDVKAIDYDRYLAESHNTVHGIMNLGFHNLRPLAQTIGVLSTPTKMIETMVLNKSINFENPVARWMFANVQLATDANGNVKPDKAKSQNKIDGVAALVNAVKGWMDDTANQRDFDNQVYSL